MELEVGKRKRGDQKGDGLIASREIWKWLESKKRTQESKVHGEQQSAPVNEVGIKLGGERERESYQKLSVLTGNWVTTS